MTALAVLADSTRPERARREAVVTGGPRETGGRVALSVFQELMLKVYRDRIVGPVPAFPDQMEQRITRFLQGDTEAIVASAAADSIQRRVQ